MHRATRPRLKLPTDNPVVQRLLKLVSFTDAYLDGAWVDTKTDTDGVVSTGYGNDLELAIAVPEDPQKAWDGLVDEVLIFNRVLDADEIKALYDSTANQFHNNYQGLDPGVHEFVGHSVNAAGVRSQTGVRNVTIN